MSFGRLERTPGNAPMGDINMTPLIDVMLVLLVIFIITAPLMVSAVKVELPKAAAVSSQNPVVRLEITLTQAGEIFLNEKALTPQALQEAFNQAALRNPETEIQLRADTAVPYGRVVALMGQAHQAGLNRIGFVSELSPP